MFTPCLPLLRGSLGHQPCSRFTVVFMNPPHLPRPRLASLLQPISERDPLVIQLHRPTPFASVSEL